MTDQERLQLIIETALKHGWKAGKWIGMRCDDILWQIIYGDNLSLLKAVFKNDEFDDGDNIAERVACMTVVRPDKERLKVIYDLMVVSNESRT